MIRFKVGELDVSKSVLDAIREGKWDFEPDFGVRSQQGFQSTIALPGSKEKVSALAARAESGLPLWHPEDRKVFDESNVD